MAMALPGLSVRVSSAKRPHSRSTALRIASSWPEMPCVSESVFNSAVTFILSFYPVAGAVVGVSVGVGVKVAVGGALVGVFVAVGGAAVGVKVAEGIGEGV